MSKIRSMPAATLAVLGIASAGLLTAFTGTASADAGRCIEYLTSLGEDNSVRTELCAKTETLADTVSQDYARTICVPGMEVTDLRQEWAVQACEFAIEP